MQVSYKNATDMQVHLTASIPESERWVSQSIHISESDVATFWMRDLQACITKLFGNPEHGEKFAYAYDPDAKNEPHGTTVWQREEVHIKSRVGGHAFIAGVQLYADATLVNLKGTSVHPVYMCLLNHSYSNKIKCIERVAYLPELKDVDNKASDAVRLNRLSLYHTAFKMIMQPLRDMTHGIMMDGPDGIARLVVPVLLDFCGDNPEV